jgi:hypothetical protein
MKIFGSLIGDSLKGVWLHLTEWTESVAANDETFYEPPGAA